MESECIDSLDLRRFLESVFMLGGSEISVTSAPSEGTSEELYPEDVEGRAVSGVLGDSWF